MRWAALAASLAALVLALLAAVAPERLGEACGCGGVLGIPPRYLGLPWPPAWLGVAGVAVLVGLQVKARPPAKWFASLLCGGQLYFWSWLVVYEIGPCPVCIAFGTLLGLATAMESRALHGRRRAALGQLLVMLLVPASCWTALSRPEASEDVAPPSMVSSGVVAELFLEEGCRVCDEQLVQAGRLDGLEIERVVVHVRAGPSWPNDKSRRRADDVAALRLPVTLLWHEGRLVRRFNALAESDELRRTIRDQVTYMP